MFRILILVASGFGASLKPRPCLKFWGFWRMVLENALPCLVELALGTTGLGPDLSGLGL